MEIIFFLLICGVIGAALRSSKNEAGAGFLAGLLLGPLGILIAVLMPASEKARARTEKQCPDCAEWVKQEATVCKHCGYTAPGPGSAF